MATSRNEYLKTLNKMRDNYQNNGNAMINTLDDSTSVGEELSSFAYMDTKIPSIPSSSNENLASIKEESDFSSPDYIAAYYMEDMRHLSIEKVMLLLLDGRHRLMKEILLSKGTANSSWVPVRSIFVEALRCEAVYMILIHNHPSGYPEPSREDLIITKQIKEAGELLGIPLSDHIIIGDKCYTSLREQNMM